MLSAEEIRNDPEIKTFLNKYGGAAKQVTRAIEILSKKADGLAAVKKILPALAEKTLFVFFSYKTKDEAAAKTIVNLLRTYAAGKLKIAYQADFGKESLAGNGVRRFALKYARRTGLFCCYPTLPWTGTGACTRQGCLIDNQHQPIG